ncbi:MAG TPA: DUF1707 domain-containing protein, partial [Acidimicrobiales bacterium]|nr:DUF1707 domain-containing protein [Acidimicrobiales bacterium]
MHKSSRISDAERDAVVTVLGRNAAEGRLSIEELEERLSKVYAARTYGEVEPILVDLPHFPTSAGPVSPAGTELPPPREDRRS